MTIKEFIKLLETHDQNLNIFISGYEGGCQDIEIITGPIDVVLNYNDNTNWWYGPHEAIDKIDNITAISNYEIIKGIIIKRTKDD